MNRSSLARAALAAAFLFPSTLCLAQAQSVVVTGSREPLPPERLAADVVVIDAATVRASSADSVADLLRREAGIQLSRNGGPGQVTSIFVRGAASSQTVVLVDGVRIGSATVGSASLEGLSLAQVDHIEVLRGPGSSLYGADAVGGVVQIFTRRADAGQASQPGTRADARAAVGGYGSSELAAKLSGSAGTWDGAVGLSRDRSEGLSALRPGDQFGNYNPDHDGFTRNAAQAQLGFTPLAGQRIGLTLLRSRLDSQYDGSDFLPPTYAQDNTPDFRTRLRTDVAALDWRGSLGSSLTGSARLSRSVDDSTSGGRAPDSFRTTRQAASAQLAWQTGVLGQLVGAVEHEQDKAHATTFVADVERRITALVASLTGSAGAWSWQADLRHDDNSDFGGVTTGRVGGAFAITPALRLRALAGNTFRAPAFNELYYPGYGVATLGPERGRSVELGLNWRVADGELAATVYRNRVRDLIAYESNRSFCPAGPAYDFGCARNVNRARLQGATLSGRQRFGGLALQAQLDLLGANDQASGTRLPRRAAHQEALGAAWDAGPWSVGADVLRLGARPDSGKQLAAETTLNLQASWRFATAWALTAKLLNATDRNTEPARDYQGLGRQAWLGLRFDGGL